MKKVIHLIAGARPNFIKIAPVYHALSKENWAEPRIIHTGQHYDLNMSDVFFRDLRIPDPFFHLQTGSGTHAQQTGKIMIEYEKVLIASKPDLVIVVGDVNSTMAVTLVASKIMCPVAHLEAGLRSFDRSMPEEINRIVTDVLADILWTPSPDADENLVAEGISRHKIERVGNIMIDALEMLRHRIEKETIPDNFDLDSGKYILVTLHRPSNVDLPNNLKKICIALRSASEKFQIIFPVHPRTLKNLITYGFMKYLSGQSNIRIINPFSYIPFMSLVFNSGLIITDSGGLQEETTYLGIPCITLRTNTERPITIKQGTNRLCKIDHLVNEIDASSERGAEAFSIPELWDGYTANRVVRSLENYFNTTEMATGLN